jgi:hypothetical protein
VEGVVIVSSILLAFGIDAWWDDRGDRRAEVQYLQRLLDDVRYDRAENQAVTEVLNESLTATDELLGLIAAGSLDPSEAGRWIPLLVSAARTLQPDYSRGTYEDLVTSGRTELIRSASVRARLAEYDRAIGNMDGTWAFLRGEGRGAFWWMPSRWIPGRVLADATERVCAEAVSECVVSLGDWDPSALTARLSQTEVVNDIREARFLKRRIVGQIRFLEQRASTLEAELLAVLDGG